MRHDPPPAHKTLLHLGAQEPPPRDPSSKGWTLPGGMIRPKWARTPGQKSMSRRREAMDGRVLLAGGTQP